MNRNDVTNEYKYEEGTAEEREAFRKAYSFGSTPAYQENFLSVQEEGDIEISEFQWSLKLFRIILN